MTRLTRLTAMATAAAMALPIAACSGGDDYCDAIRDAQERNPGLGLDDPTDPDVVNGFAESFDKIADAAPSEIAEDWQTTVNLLHALAEVEDPDQVDEETQQMFADAEPAFDNITEHSLEECDIDIS